MLTTAPTMVSAGGETRVRAHANSTSRMGAVYSMSRATPTGRRSIAAK
jgi:hypothetical protein